MISKLLQIKYKNLMIIKPLEVFNYQHLKLIPINFKRNKSIKIIKIDRQVANILVENIKFQTLIQVNYVIIMMKIKRLID